MNGEVPSSDGRAGQDERELVRQAQAGERQAFNRLVLAYQDRIMTLCVRLLGDRQEAEEAAQDTFVRAYRSLAGFKSEALFGTWVYRIALNTCHNRQRSWWRRLTRKAVPVEDPDDPETDRPGRQVADTSMMPDRDMEAGQTRAAIGQALSKLPKIHRELIVLRDMDDRPYEEIAEMLGVTLGTIKSRLARAREAMRAELEGVTHGL